MNAKIAQILSDPAASDWLKRSLASALERDSVDAANDAEVLAAVLAAQVDPVPAPLTFDAAGMFRFLRTQQEANEPWEYGKTHTGGIYLSQNHEAIHPTPEAAIRSAMLSSSLRS
jgi:hypothetical protein